MLEFFIELGLVQGFVVFSSWGGMVERLRQLIQQYIGGDIDYGRFRNDFVRFMAASDLDPIIERVYNFVERGCSAFDNRYLDELSLKLRLQQAVPPVAQAQQNANAVVVHHVMMYVPSMVRVAPSPAGNINIGPSFPSLGSNQLVFDEPELELIELASFE